MGANATALQKSSETISSDATKMMPEMSIVSESVKTATTKCEDLSRRPSIPRCDTGTESETVAKFHWKGHWEVWEMEWGEARWIWDD